MPDLLQILCAHCSGNQILVTWRYLFLRESNNAAQCTGKHPNPQCLSAPHDATRVFATPHLGHVTMPHAYSILALRLDNAPALARHRTRPTPPSTALSPQRPGRAHPGPVPDPPCPTADPQHPPYYLGAVQEPRNKKSVRIATFLRLGIVARRQNVDFNPKTQQKRHISGLEERGRVRNRKKVATMTSFLFLQWARSPQRGKSRENARDITVRRLNPETRKAPAMRTPPEKPIWLESTLPWRHTARNKHRVQPSAYRRLPLHPELRGCTGAR